LGNEGDRRALAPLVKLVGVEDRAIAEESASFLRMLSQYEFNLPAKGAKEELLALQTHLEQWLTEQGPTVELRFPVMDSAIIRGDLAGNVLVSNGTRVMELNPAGKEVWAYPIQAWSAEKLRRGTVLIASYQANQILEVNQEGNVVWKMDGINAMRAKPLADDHILVAHFSGSRVFELNAQHQEVWTHATPDNCFDAERLPNGNTVFACPGLIREVTREGTTVRSLDVEGRVNSLQVLPNGDYLLANYGKHQVQQYDKTGKLVWRFDENSPNDAFRLKNGNTLVTSAARSVEIDSAGRVLRTIQQPSNYGCARQ
jgi:outer membrane protein assembly factor BamB